LHWHPYKWDLELKGNKYVLGVFLGGPEDDTLYTELTDQEIADYLSQGESYAAALVEKIQKERPSSNAAIQRHGHIGFPRYSMLLIVNSPREVAEGKLYELSFQGNRLLTTLSRPLEEWQSGFAGKVELRVHASLGEAREKLNLSFDWIQTVHAMAQPDFDHFVLIREKDGYRLGNAKWPLREFTGQILDWSGREFVLERNGEGGTLHLGDAHFSQCMTVALDGSALNAYFNFGRDYLKTIADEAWSMPRTSTHWKVFQDRRKKQPDTMQAGKPERRIWHDPIATIYRLDPRLRHDIAVRRRPRPVVALPCPGCGDPLFARNAINLGIKLDSSQVDAGKWLRFGGHFEHTVDWCMKCDTRVIEGKGIGDYREGSTVMWDDFIIQLQHKECTWVDFTAALRGAKASADAYFQVLMDGWDTSPLHAQGPVPVSFGTGKESLSPPFTPSERNQLLKHLEASVSMRADMMRSIWNYRSFLLEPFRQNPPRRLEELLQNGWLGRLMVLRSPDGASPLVGYEWIAFSVHPILLQVWTRDLQVVQISVEQPHPASLDA
jgi:hypothetical protein